MEPGADGGLALPGSPEPLPVEIAVPAEPAVPVLPEPEAQAVVPVVVAPAVECMPEPTVAAAPVDDAEVQPAPAGAGSPSIDPVVFGAPPRHRRLGFLAFLLLGLLAVAGQTLWFRFDVLARDPAWRPVSAEICRWVGCKLPVQRDIRRIRTRNLTVQSAGEGSGNLRIRVTIVNEAEFAQPFPRLDLRFST